MNQDTANYRTCMACDARTRDCGKSPCLCTAANESISVTIKNGCPLGKFQKATGTHPPLPTFEERGRALWAEMHARDYAGDALAELAWLTAIAASFPPACGCAREYAAYLSATPPTLADAAAYRRWTYDLHNAVNRRLNKAELDYPAAAALWGW